ncbi:major facilitator superfamily domain-containing protein [Chytridium lagenaria]|nr:major facilitator superfamily domain-containing protein [Chytridium lagenaria]
MPAQTRSKAKTSSVKEASPASKSTAAAKVPIPADEAFVKKSLKTIFVALLLDILAFTIILPLYPRILDHYQKTDGENENSFFYAILTWVRRFRTAIGGTHSRMDIVIFGGVLGSLFSFLQVISSPFIGSLSDRYGRKNVLLFSMIGNAISMLLWIFSKSFFVFVLSRIVGGLTEGNVQMSIAMISDITTPETRSRGLALVGIAFSLGFTVGPPLGAYFASLDLIKMFPMLDGYSINTYSSPALFAFVLIIIETIYMHFALPETLNFKQRSAKVEKESAKDQVDKPINTKALLGRLSLIHFLFLFLFSGMEFTLTFLTHDRFHFTHGEQGRYLGYIGVITALVQGGYVRRVAHKSVPEKISTFLAFTSGTVVTTKDGDELKQGKVLGEFRSLGQLGRAIGPLVACSGYWILGRAVGLLAVGVLWIIPTTVLRPKPKRD